MLPIGKATKNIALLLLLLPAGALVIQVAEHRRYLNNRHPALVSRPSDEELDDVIRKALGPIFIQEGERCGSNVTEDYVNCSGIERVIPDVPGIEPQYVGRPVQEVHTELGVDGFREKIFIPYMFARARSSRCDLFSNDPATFATCLMMAFNMGHERPGDRTPSVCRDLTTARPYAVYHAINHLLLLAETGASYSKMHEVLRGYQHHHYDYIVALCPDLEVYRDGGWSKNQRLAHFMIGFQNWDEALTEFPSYMQRFRREFRAYEFGHDYTVPPGIIDPLGEEVTPVSTSSQSLPHQGAIAIFENGELKTVGPANEVVDPASTLKLPIAALAIIRQTGLNPNLQQLIQQALVISDNPAANQLITLAGGIGQINQDLQRIDSSLKLSRNFGESGPNHRGTTVAMAKMLKEFLDPESSVFAGLTDQQRDWILQEMAKTPREAGFSGDDDHCRFSEIHTVQKCGVSAGNPSDITLLFYNRDSNTIGAISMNTKTAVESAVITEMTLTLEQYP